MSGRRASMSSLFSGLTGSSSTDRDETLNATIARSQPSRQLVRALPSGGRTRGPQRIMPINPPEAAGNPQQAEGSGRPYRTSATSLSLSGPLRFFRRSESSTSTSSSTALTAQNLQRLVRQGHAYAPPSGNNARSSTDSGSWFRSVESSAVPSRASSSRHLLDGFQTGFLVRPSTRVENIDSDVGSESHSESDSSSVESIDYDAIRGALMSFPPRLHGRPVRSKKTSRTQQTGQLIRRQIKLPMILHATSKLRRLALSLGRKGSRLSVLDLFQDSSSSMGKSTNSSAWTDLETWGPEEEEYGSEYDTDDPDYWEGLSELSQCSDSDEDFGCWGLYVEEYEEMLEVAPGYRQWIVESVDKWPEELRVYGYRKLWGVPKNIADIDFTNLGQYFNKYGDFWKEKEPIKPNRRLTKFKRASVETIKEEEETD
ncbi:hypothetical protein TWF694_004094 [Orbilia ellipsospora]|uniref:Uncharacterized protein n=1 Tax=Orbilia ellipsospora TaxID=2528407 RepID=A0AAV9WZI0_9PEZI